MWMMSQVNKFTDGIGEEINRGRRVLDGRRDFLVMIKVNQG